MSIKHDILLHFCEDIYRERMTVKERAKLLCDLMADLDFDTYDRKDCAGNYLGYDLEKAIKDIEEVDSNSIPLNEYVNKIEDRF